MQTGCERPLYQQPPPWIQEETPVLYFFAPEDCLAASSCNAYRTGMISTKPLLILEKSTLSEHFIEQGGHLSHSLFIPRQVCPIEIGQRDVNADIGKQGNRFALDAILLQIFGILKICIKSLPAFKRIPLPGLSAIPVYGSHPLCISPDLLSAAIPGPAENLPRLFCHA